MAEMKKRGDFPMTGAGSSQWRAYQKEHGLGAYAGGGQSVKREKADETVHVGRGATGQAGAAPQRRDFSSEAAHRAAVLAWNRRVIGRESPTPEEEAQRRMLQAEAKKKAEKKE